MRVSQSDLFAGVRFPGVALVCEHAPKQSEYVRGVADVVAVGFVGMTTLKYVRANLPIICLCDNV